MKYRACLTCFAIAAVFIVLMSGCQTMEKPVRQPAYYEKYDLYVSELRNAVDRGEMTVEEAESLRQKAYADYVKELGDKRIEAEYRNY